MVSTACTNGYALSTGGLQKKSCNAFATPLQTLYYPYYCCIQFYTRRQFAEVFGHVQKPPQTVCRYQTACSSSMGSKEVARTSQGGCNIMHGLKIRPHLRTQNLQGWWDHSLTKYDMAISCFTLSADHLMRLPTSVIMRFRCINTCTVVQIKC